MKKKRIFYLDFIRAIAAISIIITHFNATYIYRFPQLPDKFVITNTVAGIPIGSWGVSIFFIISGAALMYTYDNRFEIKTYIKKRFLSIYPMYWIAYFFGFLFIFYYTKTVYGGGVPKINFLLTIIGFDGYLAENVQTFYLLGEWFLGAIILIYILFPLLRKMVRDYPKIFLIILVVIYLVTIFFYNIPFNKEKFIFTRLPEFAFGMYFIKYIKKVNLGMFIVAMFVIVINTLIKPAYEVIDVSMQVTYIGIASFIVLVYLSYFLENKLFVKISSYISKYSYSIFLVHHVIITVLMGQFNLDTISITGSYVLFILCCTVIFFIAYLLYKFHRCLMNEVNDILAKT